MQTNAKINCIRIIRSDFFCGIHQFASNSVVSILFKYTKIHNFRIAPIFKWTFRRIRIYIDVSGYISLILCNQCNTLSICLVLQSHFVLLYRLLPSLCYFFLRNNWCIAWNHIANDYLLIFIKDHFSPLS